MNTMEEFARTLISEAEKRGLRIIVEPIPGSNIHATKTPVETHETELVSLPTDEAASVSATKITNGIDERGKSDRDKVREEKSWITVRDLAQMLDVPTGNIYSRINCGLIKTKTIGNGPMLVSTEWLHGLPQYKGRVNGCIPVQCVETGKIFPSITQAAIESKVSVSDLTTAMRKGWAIRGCHFRKLGV